MRADFMNDYNKIMQGTDLDLLGSNMKGGSNEKFSQLSALKAHNDLQKSSSKAGPLS